MPFDNNKPARPWDIFNKNITKVETSVAAERLEICKMCSEYTSTTHQCKKCGCIMNLKTKLPHASCPLQKWQAISVSYKEEL